MPPSLCCLSVGEGNQVWSMKKGRVRKLTGWIMKVDRGRATGHDHLGHNVGKLYATGGDSETQRKG